MQRRILPVGFHPHTEHKLGLFQRIVDRQSRLCSTRNCTTCDSSAYRKHHRIRNRHHDYRLPRRHGIMLQYLSCRSRGQQLVYGTGVANNSYRAQDVSERLKHDGISHMLTKNKIFGLQWLPGLCELFNPSRIERDVLLWSPYRRIPSHRHTRSGCSEYAFTKRRESLWRDCGGNSD